MKLKYVPKQIDKDIKVANSKNHRTDSVQWFDGVANHHPFALYYAKPHPWFRVLVYESLFQGVISSNA